MVEKYAAAQIEAATRADADKSSDGSVAKYREMAADSDREREAEEWCEGLIGDASHRGEK